MAAQLAGIGRPIGQAVVLGGLSALPIEAVSGASEAQIHDVFEAHIVVRELLKKRLDRELCHDCLLPRETAYQKRFRVSRGYMPLKLYVSKVAVRCFSWRISALNFCASSLVPSKWTFMMTLSEGFGPNPLTRSRISTHSKRPVDFAVS
jgi:hypothetical protein